MALVCGFLDAGPRHRPLLPKRPLRRLRHGSILHSDDHLWFHHLEICERQEEATNRPPCHSFQEKPHPSMGRRHLSALGWSLVAACHPNRLSRANSRQFHHGIEFCRHMGIGKKIFGTVAHLDCSRHCDMRTVFLQRHTFQSQSLWSLRRHSHNGLSQVEKDDDKTV